MQSFVNTGKVDVTLLLCSAELPESMHDKPLKRALPPSGPAHRLSAAKPCLLAAAEMGQRTGPPCAPS